MNKKPEIKFLRLLVDGGGNKIKFKNKLSCCNFLKKKFSYKIFFQFLFF